MRQSALSEHEPDGRVVDYAVGIPPGYDNETDVLTREGFVPWPEVEDGSEFATLSPDGELEYQRPDEIWRVDYTGEIHHYSNRQVDFRITPSQRIWSRKRNGEGPLKDSPWRLRTSRDISERCRGGVSTGVIVRRDLTWTGTPIKSVPLAEPEPMCSNVLDPDMPVESYLIFLGWFIGDGSTSEYHNEKVGTVRQTAIRAAQEHKERLLGLANDIGINAHWDDNGHGRLMISSKHLYEHLEPLGKSAEKHIPRWVMELPPEQLEYIYKGLLISDGCHDSRTEERGLDTAQFVLSSEQLADDLQELALKMGRIAARYTVVGGESNYIPGKEYCRTNIYDSYLKTGVRSVDIGTYSGTVYGAAVPSGKLLTRRNGRLVWGG